MKFIDQISEKINEDIHIQALIKVILVLLVIFLVRSIDVVWMGLFRKAWHILRPFVLGFIIAYVIHPLIEMLEKKYKISRKITIPVFYLILLVVLFWLAFTIVPLIYSRLSSFITSMISGVNSIYNSYVNLSESGAPEWLRRLLQEIVASLQSTRSILPQLSTRFSSMLSDAVQVFTIFVITIIVSIYMCFSWKNIEAAIYNFAKRLGNRAIRNIKAVDVEIGTYVRSLLVLIVIKFLEYALMYYLVGHKDWLLVSLLTALGLIVPYIGPMIGNTVGILTALTMPQRNVIILLVCIVVLSQLDAYIIEPLVHSRNVKISPLWALFSIYAGGILAGGLGVMVAIPAYLAVRTMIRTNTTQV
jgi:predicted PurR-regulated permease PerM